MKNRILALLLSGALALTGCGKGSTKAADKSSSQADSSSQAEMLTTDSEDKLGFAERVNSSIEASKAYFESGEQAEQSPLWEESRISEMKSASAELGVFPAFDDTQAVYYPTGEEAYEAMLDELEKAQDFIFMEYFIIDQGEMLDSVVDILTQKAAEGVEVRLMYDGTCETTGRVPKNFTKTMEEKGISCRSFFPIGLSGSENYDNRDHRKLLIIDGKTAFTGGINIADEYINKIEKYGHWKDNSIMIRGSAVNSCTVMFLQLWNMDEKSPDWDKYLTAESAEGSGLVLPYCDSPLDSDTVGEDIYIDILNNAKSYVHIMSPYLVLDDRIESAIKAAAERGVDVSLILPGIPDKAAVYTVAKTHYQSLKNSGVKLYEYSPGFIHSKVFVSDDNRAVVGTINLDYRSFMHHFECALYFYGSDVIADIQADFENTLPECRLVTQEVIDELTLSEQIQGGIFRGIAPLM